MPKPRKGEKKSEYISRCVKAVVGEGKSQQAALGQCYGMWNQHKKEMAKHSMEYITLNFDTSVVQEKTLHGEEYYVVPTAMMVPGVHDGSHGELFYSDEELEKWTPAWNHKPIVVDHPDEGSACTQEFLEANGIGFVLDAMFDGKQRSASWINKKRCQEREPRIIEAIKNKKMMEVSTGLFVDKLKSPGTFEGQSYKYKAVNHKPDHLAILPDKIGACSIKKGAGLLQLNADERASLTKDIAQQVVSELRPHLNKGDADMAKKDWIDAIIKNSERTGFEESDRKELEGFADKSLEKMAKSVEKQEKKPAVSFNTQEEFDKKVKEELEKKTSSPDFIKELKKKQEDELAKNEAAEKAKKDSKKPQSMDEFMASVPPEFKGMVSNWQKVHNAEKDRLIGIIVANKANSFSKEWLATQELGTLQAMAALAAPVADPSAPPAPQYNFLGAPAPAPVVNDHKEEGLSTPVYNDKDFAKELIGSK